MSTFQFTNHFGVYFWWVLQKSQFIVARTKNNEIGTTFSLNWSKKWPPQLMGRFGRFYKKKCCQVWLGSPWPTQHQIDRTELPWENVSRIMSSFKMIKKFRTASCWTIWQRQEQLFLLTWNLFLCVPNVLTTTFNVKIFIFTRFYFLANRIWTLWRKYVAARFLFLTASQSADWGISVDDFYHHIIIYSRSWSPLKFNSVPTHVRKIS